MATAGRIDAPHEEEVFLPYAGVALRIVAALLDFIAVTAILALFVAAAGLLVLSQTDWGAESIDNDAGWMAAIVLGSYFAFVPWYFTALWWWKGQTPGMMAVHIGVTDREGYHVSFGRSLLRTLVWPLSVLPLGAGLLPIFFDEESRALHDMLAGTVVVELP